MSDAERPRVIRRRSKEIRDYRDLRVWRKAAKLRADCEAAVEGFSTARVPMARQIRELSRRVPTWIQSGHDGGFHAPYVELLGNALTDLGRLERRLIGAHEASCLSADVGDRLLTQVAEIRRMLRKLVASLEAARHWRAGS